jgi:hypothetical protein
MNAIGIFGGNAETGLRALVDGRFAEPSDGESPLSQGGTGSAKQCDLKTAFERQSNASNAIIDAVR